METWRRRELHKMLLRPGIVALTLLLRSGVAIETGTVDAGVSTFAVSFSGEYADPVVIAVRPS
eukprot:COSAG02_NODE_30_length_50867_cov_66.594331_29_plen_63_part_00